MKSHPWRRSGIMRSCTFDTLLRACTIKVVFTSQVTQQKEGTFNLHLSRTRPPDLFNPFHICPAVEDFRQFFFLQARNPGTLLQARLREIESLRGFKEKAQSWHDTNCPELHGTGNQIHWQDIGPLHAVYLLQPVGCRSTFSNIVDESIIIALSQCRTS